jgi:citrate lyase beta subunit
VYQAFAAYEEVALAAAQARGDAVIALDGRILDASAVAQAREALARAAV